MSDTTSENARAFDEATDRAAEFMNPAISAARDAGVPERFDDSTAVFLHRTAVSGGYVLAAFDPQVLIRWAASGGFALLKAQVNFLPMGMPVLSLELEDLDATKNGNNEASDQDKHPDAEARGQTD